MFGLGIGGEQLESLVDGVSGEIGHSSSDFKGKVGLILESEILTTIGGCVTMSSGVFCGTEGRAEVEI